MMHREMFLFCIGTAEGGVWSIYGGRRKKLAVEELREHWSGGHMPHATAGSTLRGGFRSGNGH